jgi:hypothetical protein
MEKVYHCYQLLTKFYSTFYSQVKSIYRKKVLGIINMGFDGKDEQLFMLSSFFRDWRKMVVCWDSKSAIHRLQEII